MPSVTTLRPFELGTTGWSASDLDDPRIEAEWNKGRYEIVEGVLTMMAPAYFIGGSALFKLLSRLDHHLAARGRAWEIATEVDIIIDESRMAVADAVVIGAEERALQAQRAAALSKDPARTRLLVPPRLIVESISPGHELHDRRTKMRWYAEFGVPNYWILDSFEKTLECMVLVGSSYRLDQSGRGDDLIHPSLLPGLALSLGELLPK